MESKVLNQFSARPRWSMRENRVISTSATLANTIEDHESIVSHGSCSSKASVKWDRTKHKVVGLEFTKWDAKTKTVKRKLDGQHRSSYSDHSNSESSKNSLVSSTSPKSVMAPVPEHVSLEYHLNQMELEEQEIDYSLNTRPHSARPASANIAASKKREKEKKLRDMMNALTTRMKEEKNHASGEVKFSDIPSEITAPESSDQSIVSNFTDLFSS